MLRGTETRSSKRRWGWAAGIGAGLSLLLACAPAPPPPPARTNLALAASLFELGVAALREGDLEEAEERFERARRAAPGAGAPRIGLGQVAFAREDWAAAEAQFSAALEDPLVSTDAELALVRVDQKLGRKEAGIERLQRVIAKEPRNAEAHAGLLEFTGPAPRGRTDLAGALARSREHPYDVRAALTAARRLRQAGRPAKAAQRLESILWLADLDPANAQKAWELLREIDPSWLDWQVVLVHAYADQSLHRQPGWRFRLRFEWLHATRTLAPLLKVRFLPVRIESIVSSDRTGSLDAIQAAFDAQIDPAPVQGIVALFTERQADPRHRKRKLGQAEFLGRRMVVRLGAAGDGNRVLLHEILHLYGGVHVLRDVESLMNPSGESESLDRLNADIVRQLRKRRFQGTLEEAVLERIDLDATIAAYEAALGANLALRNAGLTDAIHLGNAAPITARNQARRAIELDAHLGDVARFLAALYRRDERPVSAAFLLERAALLYGPHSRRGREVASEAKALWNAMLPTSDREP